MSRFLLYSFLVFFVFILFCIYLLRFAAYPHFHSESECLEREEKKVNLDEYKALYKEDYIISSFDGYQIYCTFVPNQTNQKIIILTHGHAYTYWGSIKYLLIFYHLGYSAILYDNRGHGRNQKHIVTMGHLEQIDLLTVIEDTKKRFGPDCFIGLHGESMGSSISLLALSYHPPIQFVVSDCGYSDLSYFYRMLLKKRFHLPSFVVTCSNQLNKLLFGYYFSDIKPIDSLYKNNIPICFIHGRNDRFIDCYNAVRMFDVNAGYKELHLFDDATHAGSYQSNPKLYKDIVTSFVTKVEAMYHNNESR